MEPLINPGTNITPNPEQPLVQPQVQPQIINQDVVSQQPIVNEVLAPTPQVVSGQPAPVVVPNQANNSTIKKILVTLLILCVISGTGYTAYIYKDTIKAYIPYFGEAVIFTEDNFAVSLIDKITAINSAEYTLSANVSITDREKGTVSMDSKLGPSLEKIESYKNDYKNIQAFSSLFSTLRYGNNYGYSNISKSAPGVTSSIYPKDLVDLEKLFIEKNGAYSSGMAGTISSLIVNKKITYKTIDNGDNFELSLTLETDEAINAIKENMTRMSSYSVGTSSVPLIKIEGKTIVLTKVSNTYFYISAEMKRPLLSQLGYYLKELPQEFSIKGTSTVLSKTEAGVDPEIQTNLTAEGDFSDLSYKLNFDTVLKDKIFYYHINNFPALGLFGGLSVLKGKWIKVDTSTSSSNRSDYIGQISFNAQKNIQENKERTKKIMTALAQSADSSHLIAFVEKPIHEKIGKEEVVRYQFFLNKDSIPAFLAAFEQASASDPEVQKSFTYSKKEIEETIASPDFNEIYDYSKENIFLTIWTRKDGTPIKWQMRLRVIPSLESKNLNDKQIEIVVTMMLSKINETILIDVPKEAKTFIEVMGTSSRGLW